MSPCILPFFFGITYSAIVYYHLCLYLFMNILPEDFHMFLRRIFAMIPVHLAQI